ncbi:hypothetical protein EHS25_003147 [Saitozyma podzolica]|uniref:Origin recognition complex subunit 3 winged helix C-terminal domain-containing protein n=1 Tax=Saitozyma podzolica TaxID=1890683 RepID=A0A427Y823_9TREE|nr:hypothetical protein EHS25_003147 [Saitozyma podzolica]
MTDDDFQSLSKGVFVVPFNPDQECSAGPSKPNRPLGELYDSLYERCEQAYNEYEASRTAEQLDDIADWLDRSSAPPILKFTFPIHRLPIAVIQNISASLPPLLSTLPARACTLQGRELGDVALAVRAVSVGFLGEAVVASKKSGRAGIEEVERWWLAQKDQQAQLVPSNVLAEVFYILGLHPDLPIRVLLSVPSISTFLANWTHVEPSMVDLTVMDCGKGRKRAGGINAILRAATGADNGGLRIADELAEDIREQDAATGGGAQVSLKALKWSFLHHSFNSPLSDLAQGDDRAREVHSALNVARADPDSSFARLTEIGPHSDMTSTLDPAPRISILHALAHPDEFDPGVFQIDKQGSLGNEPPAATTSARKACHIDSHQSRNGGSASPPPPNGLPTAGDTDMSDSFSDGKGDLAELQMLFNLWQSAGRSVNLWDWLEGFRSNVLHPSPAVAEVAGVPADQDMAVTEDAAAGGGAVVGKRKRGGPVEKDGEDGADDAEADADEKEDEDKAARLHATFVRFCEEARMLGLPAHDAGPSIAVPRTTRSMLDEIECGTAAEAVLSMRYINSPPGPTFLQRLDEELLAARPHPGGSTLQRGDLLEVVGPSGSGKTSILNFFLLTSLLPSSFRLPPTRTTSPTEIQLGGKSFHAALLHPETHRSPLPTLVRGMRAHITSCVESTLASSLKAIRSDADVARAMEDVVLESLRRLRVIKLKPRYKSWALALRTLHTPPYIPSGHRGRGKERGHRLDLVVCDGLGDGLWPERWAEEERGGRRKGTGKDAGIRAAEDVGMRDVMDGIGRLRKELGAVVVISVQGYWHEKKDNSNETTPFFSPHLPPPFPAPYAQQPSSLTTAASRDPAFWPLTAELTLTGRHRAMQLSASVGLVDALRQAEQHGWEDVQIFDARLRVPDGRGRAGTREGVIWTFGMGPEGIETYVDGS